jgi:amino acid transporter
MYKNDLAISLISASIIIILVPTIFYTVGRYIEKVLMKKELTRMLNLLDLPCSELIKLRKNAEQELIKQGDESKIECNVCIPPLYVYIVIVTLSLSLFVMGLVASQFESLGYIFKHVLLVVIVFVLIDVQILLFLGVLYKPLNIYTILHK